MTTHEFARQYVAEHYDNQLVELQETQYADLSPTNRARFDALVDAEARSLHSIIVRACEAWAMDADILELGVHLTVQREVFPLGVEPDTDCPWVVYDGERVVARFPNEQMANDYATGGD